MTNGHRSGIRVLAVAALATIMTGAGQAGICAAGSAGADMSPTQGLNGLYRDINDLEDKTFDLTLTVADMEEGSLRYPHTIEAYKVELSELEKRLETKGDEFVGMLAKMVDKVAKTPDDSASPKDLAPLKTKCDQRIDWLMNKIDNLRLAIADMEEGSLRFPHTLKAYKLELSYMNNSLATNQALQHLLAQLPQ